MAENLLDYLHLRRQPENINLKHNQGLSFHERVALHTTEIVGTMYAVYFTTLFLIGWMVWQAYIASKPIDPYPFAFLLFMASVVQLPLMSLIMVGQNLQGRHSGLRAEEEFKTTETIYKDIEKIFMHLDAQDKKMEEQKELLTKLLQKQ